MTEQSKIMQAKGEAGPNFIGFNSGALHSSMSSTWWFQCENSADQYAGALGAQYAALGRLDVHLLQIAIRSTCGT